MSSPQPTTQRRWLGDMVTGQPTPRGGLPPVDASLPLLAQVVACLHAEALQLGPRARNSL
jgi:hypothetical protein